MIEENEREQTNEGETDTAAGQLQIVMFELSGEAYGISLDIVQEVIRVAGITRVPQTPDFIDGVINLRGYVVPVIDLKKRFNLGRVEPGKSARIMIIDIEDQIAGIAVDKVLEVVTIHEGDVEPPSPLILNTIKSDYLVGFVEFNGELIKILDIAKVFSEHELDALKNME